MSNIIFKKKWVKHCGTMLDIIPMSDIIQGQNSFKTKGKMRFCGIVQTVIFIR